MQSPSINSVLIVGAGWVGRQIALRFAQFGLRVCLADRSESAIDAARELLKKEAIASGHTQWLPEIYFAATPYELPGEFETGNSVDLVIESVPEQLSVKKRVLQRLGRHFIPSTIIVSNSSYFVPSVLSEFVEHPDRYAHLHFHVPVTKSSVADIVGCSATKPAVIEALRCLAERVEQYPLVLKREHPGYVFNWLLQSVLRAALELAAEGVADVEEIDRSWRSVTGMERGPFAMMDAIGLDVIEQVLANAKWSDHTPTDESRLRELIGSLTDEGHLGIKSGKGFYDYGQPTPSE